MKYKHLIIGIGIGAVLGSIVTGFLTRRNGTTEHFTMHLVSGSVNGHQVGAIKMNTLTGETWGLTSDGWKLISN